MFSASVNKPQMVSMGALISSVIEVVRLNVFFSVTAWPFWALIAVIEVINNRMRKYFMKIRLI
jgi:hypothetical protein